MNLIQTSCHKNPSQMYTILHEPSANFTCFMEHKLVFLALVHLKEKEMCNSYTVNAELASIIKINTHLVHGSSSGLRAYKFSFEHSYNWSDARVIIHVWTVLSILYVCTCTCTCRPELALIL